MPATAAAKPPRWDRVENALVTAAGYRRLAALSRTEETRRHMLRRAAAWEKRAGRFEQEELAFPSPGSAAAPEPNPCRKLFGPGPAGTRCAGCALLHETRPGHRSYHQCELRLSTPSQRGGHRLRWRACRRFEPREE